MSIKTPSRAGMAANAIGVACLVSILGTASGCCCTTFGGRGKPAGAGNADPPQVQVASPSPSALKPSDNLTPLSPATGPTAKTAKTPKTVADPGADKPAAMDVPPGWREYVPKNAMFAMALPPSDKNSDRTRILTLGKHKVPVEESYSFKDGVAYSAGSIGIPAVVMRDIPADRRFETLRDMFARNVKGTVSEEKDLMLDEVPGKEYVYSSPQGPVRIQIYTIAGWVVCPIVEGKQPQHVRSAEADTFFATLRLSEKAKEVFQKVKR